MKMQRQEALRYRFICCFAREAEEENGNVALSIFPFLFSYDIIYHNVEI